MKATFNIPDDLYRQAESRSASGGALMKDVAVWRSGEWLGQSSPPVKKMADWKNHQPLLRHLVSESVDDHRGEAVCESIGKKFDEDL